MLTYTTLGHTTQDGWISISYSSSVEYDKISKHFMLKGFNLIEQGCIKQTSTAGSLFFCSIFNNLNDSWCQDVLFILINNPSASCWNLQDIQCCLILLSWCLPATIGHSYIPTLIRTTCLNSKLTKTQEGHLP